jgi:hypothetical protein
MAPLGPAKLDFGIRAPLRTDFGRFRTSRIGFWVILLGQFAGFRVAVEFRIYVKGHFAHTIQTDSPIRLAPRPATNPPKLFLRSRHRTPLSYVLDTRSVGSLKSRPETSCVQVRVFSHHKPIRSLDCQVSRKVVLESSERPRFAQLAAFCMASHGRWVGRLPPLG